MNMKRNIIYLVALLCLAFGFTSCDKESEGLTSITYYPEIALQGDDYIKLQKGEVYVDPGVVATMNGEDVTAQVQVNGEVNTSKSGVYTLTYIIFNPDGFSASTNRTVVVVDASDAIEGFWKTNANCQRINNGAAPVKYARTDGETFEILILKNEDGSYTVYDLMAGWYEQRAAYGSRYAMQGKINVADDGKITLISSFISGWGDSADKMEDGAFDASGKTISYKLFYAGVLEFDVELTKVD